jgi:hypothetical protein
MKPGASHAPDGAAYTGTGRRQFGTRRKGRHPAVVDNDRGVAMQDVAVEHKSRR